MGMGRCGERNNGERNNIEQNSALATACHQRPGEFAAIVAFES